jgi:DNA mismatch repair protein MutL
MPIHVLSPDVATKIAAGEVVERPASVVKELLENALDAGANSIHVEAAEGGRRLVRVLDDGCGISASEVELAFARYSTSKLTEAEDLDHIRTLGFRGEALASIAAVSQVTLISRTPGEEVGALLRLAGGEIAHREGRGHPPGTAITVEDLFYNTPARRKFLRAPSTERRHISLLVSRYAMAYPEVRFTLIHDGRLTFQTTGRGDLREVCIQAHGLEVARELLMVEGRGERDIGIGGLISPPTIHRGRRDQLTTFVNRRWVQDRMLAYAVGEAYHTLLPSGRHPIAVIGLTMDPTEVDVNVHPAKSEVRFRDSSAVFRVVQRSVRSTLVSEAPIPGMKLGQQWEGRPVSPHQVEAHRWQALRGVAPAGARQLPLGTERREGPALSGVEAVQLRGLPPLRVVGQVSQAYIIAEGPGGMYLIDQHAAHERVLYEQLRERQRGSGVAVQGLLSPQAVELTAEQQAVLEAQANQLEELGFDVEPFGGRTVLIRALPALLQRSSPVQILVGLLEDLAIEALAGSPPLASGAESRLMATVCKQAAVKAGKTLSVDEMGALVRQLEQTESPRTCPHGRPTMIHLSQVQLAREFGRG